MRTGLLKTTRLGCLRVWQSTATQGIPTGSLDGFLEWAPVLGGSDVGLPIASPLH
jgi:hypothetical protein